MNLKKLLVTFSHSLFWQISCLLLVVTAFAFGALFLVLQISEDSTGKGSAINVSGSLRMQSYVLALTVARSSEDSEAVRSKDIKAAIAEFERRLNLPGLTNAIPEEASNELARWGGSLGPFVLAVITGSGDAATFAFNEAVTPHALDFGMQVPNLGSLALISGSLGRTMSPIAGVVILISGLAMVPPIQLVKRTAIPMIVGVITLALIMV